ncbi:MAG: radical SAM protein, partial [Candidatus Bathyarchaeia archaeon]
VSCQPMAEHSIRTLAEAGVERLSIALDAASEAIFQEIKGKGVEGPYLWRSHIENLRMAVEVFGKGKVTTHLIVGLGETDRELLELIQELMNWGINPSLFAFTPIKGTLMEEEKPPSIERYRAIQLCRYLLSKGEIKGMDIAYNEKGRIIGIKSRSSIEDLASSEAFMTVGCPGCNRPFYNEGPRGPIYNYPRSLSEAELKEAIAAVKNYIGCCSSGQRISSNP